jgi:uncharacterized membrane protein YfcA
VAFGAAVVAGAINSVAGGGTLLTFPVLIWIGLPSITANATSTVGIWPASLGGIWGYRRELAGLTSRSYGLIVRSIAGGVIGAALLRMTPTHLFDRLVPALILFATFLFMLQELVQRGPSRSGGSASPGFWPHGACRIPQLGDRRHGLPVFRGAAYGGYFGAGIGILMLAALGVLGYTDIHQMNGLKTLLAGFINGVAALHLSRWGWQWPWRFDGRGARLPAVMAAPAWRNASA